MLQDFFKKTFKALDWQIFAYTACLTLIGLTALYSASGGNTHAVIKQFVHISLGLILMLALARTHYTTIKDWAPTVYIFGNLLLIAVLALGYISKGAQRWLGIGSLHIQPSELMKICLPLFLCWFFDNKENPPKILTLVTGAIIGLIPFILVYKQPDLGTAMVLLFLTAIVIFLAGISRGLILATMTIALGAMPLLWLHMHAYQKKRILTFLNPEADPMGSGYHIMQSKIAVGSGGLFGKGFMLGTQAQLNFLPEHTTDFIFAVIAEEFGFVGCITIIALVLLISLRIFQISKHTLKGFCQSTCAALGSLFFISAIINMAMVVGLLPVVGIPLPFVSYGGSNMLITCISLGIVMSLKNNWKSNYGA